jgi:hypothetical protein
LPTSKEVLNLMKTDLEFSSPSNIQQRKLHVRDAFDDSAENKIPPSLGKLALPSCYHLWP